MMSKKNNLIMALLAVIILALTVVYFSGVLYYKDKFLKNVYVNKINIGGMTLKEANEEFAKKDSWNKIIIKSDTEEFLEIKSEEIGYKYIGSPELPEIFNNQNKWKWLLSIFKKSVHDIRILSDYDKDRVKEMIDGIEKLDKEPLNAKVVYSESLNTFVIEPHNNAIGMTREQLFDLLVDEIDKMNSEINIEKNMVEPTIFDDDESLAKARDQANQYLNIKLIYDFEDRKEVIDSSLVKDWIVIDEKQVDINSEKVTQYVRELSRKYDTYGRGRKFKTNDGKTIITSGGSYGWVTHIGKTTEELIKYIKAGENKTIEPVYSFKALIRNSNDIGNSYVEIDLAQQMVFVYIKGELKIKTKTVTGNIARGHDTPKGVYPLNYKERDAVLRGQGYASPVKYWMPFNGNIGLHDAEWRDAFGGNIYERNGSNGCINLPPENAKTIFELVYPGMPVVVH